MSSSTLNGLNDDERSLRRTCNTFLTRVSHASAPFISVFLLIHLGSPILANVGGSSLASKMMLLGREYYQTRFGETFLLLVPLGLHSLAGITKRLLPLLPPAQRPPRPLRSVLSVAAYASLLVFLPIHFTTHRVFPSDPSPPIFAVGPSELDWEYVKFALSTWPIRSWALYTGLVSCVALHAIEGIHIIWNAQVTRLSWKLTTKQTKRCLVAIVGIALPVLSGVFAASREPLMTLSSTALRFEAAFKQSFFYRL